MPVTPGLQCQNIPGVKTYSPNAEAPSLLIGYRNRAKLERNLNKTDFCRKLSKSESRTENPIA